jgi:hypothetical protein
MADASSGTVSIAGMKTGRNPILIAKEMNSDKVLP